MIFSITIAHNNDSLGVVDCLDALQIGDRRQRDRAEGEGVVEHKVGEFIRRNEPTMRGSTPVELWLTIAQTNLVGLVGAEKIPEFNVLIDLPSRLPRYEPRLAGVRDAGGHCG
jgi:hypothetical protein